MKRIECEIVVVHSPGFVLCPAVNDEAISAQIGNVGIGLIACTGLDVNNQICEKRFKSLVGISELVLTNYLMNRQKE